MRSVPEMLARLTPEERYELLSRVSPVALQRGLWDWNSGGQSRPAQRIPPGNWKTWLMLSGRGFGKSMTLTSVVRAWSMSGKFPTTAVIGATSDDIRRVIVEGDAGVMATSPKWERPIHKKVDRALEWPNGAKSYLYSSEEPDRLRGGNNYALFCDELAAWKNARDVWDQAQFTLRRGPNPRAVVATTPRPMLLIRELASDPSTYLTTGGTYENARNLAPAFIAQMRAKYEGTRLGEQELAGKILLDTPDALFMSEYIRYAPDDIDLRRLRRVVVSVDPSGSATGDACGIVVVGEFDRGITPRYLVLEDCSVTGSPLTWAGMAARAFDRWKADLVVAETNFGGDMVLAVLQQHAPSLPVRKIHASRGKIIRAQPVALEYERGNVMHYRIMPRLEQQMVQMSESQGYTGKGSPDRVDALCHGMAYLQGVRQPPTGVSNAAPTRGPEAAPVTSTRT